MVAIVSLEHGYQQKTAELDAAVDARPVITSAHPLEESLAAFWAYSDSTRMPSVRNILFSEATPMTTPIPSMTVQNLQLRSIRPSRRVGHS